MTDSPCLDRLAHELVADLDVDADKLSHIRSELGRIHRDSIFFRTMNAGGAPSYRIKELAPIAGHARKLRQALSCRDPAIDGHQIAALVSADPSIAVLAFHLSRRLNPGLEGHVSAADDVTAQVWWADLVDKLETLEEVADTALSQLESIKKIGRGGARHTADWARRETAWYFLRLYAEVTGQKPRVSNPKTGGEPTGPAVRFLTLCLVAFGWDATPGAAAKLIRDISKDDDPPWADLDMAGSS